MHVHPDITCTVFEVRQYMGRSMVKNDLEKEPTSMEHMHKAQSIYSITAKLLMYITSKEN